jgi:nucleoside-diphosphate-sugar epimerase
MTHVAILGAGGFIGSSAVEYLHQHCGREVVPVVRRASMQGRGGDALDEEALTAAFAGCGAVVTAVAGPPSTLTGMVAPTVRAARTAGVRRIVHLSSQAVHGQAPAPGTTEESPFPRTQPFEYNRAKAQAEQMLRSVAASNGLEFVILRPGIVYGPRSRWTDGIADDLLTGEAFLAADAPAICNAIYVDNLVHAIDRAIDASDSAGETFFVNDSETIRWPELIEPIAHALGLDRASIPRPMIAEALGAGPNRFRQRALRFASPALRKLPRRLVRSTWFEPHPSDSRSHEMALLQSCAERLSDEKARRLLGYSPAISFDEGMRRSIAWLRAAGYPVA